MKRRRSLYARPVIVRGQQCAKAPLDPGGATKQLPARRYLALEGGLTAEPAWAAERRRRPSTSTRLGVPARGRSAWWLGRSGCRPRRRHLSASSASVRYPVSGASDQCPRLPVHVTGVQCPVRAYERPDVRCPASAVRRPVWASGVGVRCLCVAASAVSGRSEVMQRGGGQAAARLGWPGSAWSPAASTTGSSSARVGASCSKLAQAVLGQPRCRFGLGRRRGRWLGMASSTAWPTRTGRVHARIVRWWEPVRSELASCGRLIGMRWANRSAGLAG